VTRATAVCDPVFYGIVEAQGGDCRDRVESQWVVDDQIGHLTDAVDGLLKGKCSLITSSASLRVIIYRGGGLDAVWRNFVMVAVIGLPFFSYGLTLFRKPIATTEIVTRATAVPPNGCSGKHIAFNNNQNSPGVLPNHVFVMNIVGTRLRTTFMHYWM
jgi:hypothetical protein